MAPMQGNDDDGNQPATAERADEPQAPGRHWPARAMKGSDAGSHHGGDDQRASTSPMTKKMSQKTMVGPRFSFSTSQPRLKASIQPRPSRMAARSA